MAFADIKTRQARQRERQHAIDMMLLDRGEPSKHELRAMLAQAAANTARLQTDEREERA